MTNEQLICGGCVHEGKSFMSHPCIICRNGNEYSSLIPPPPCSGKTPEASHYKRSYKGIKLDPYRICEVYEVGGGPREQVIKKALRFTDKGHEPLQVIKEIRQALDRWEDMIKEDSK